MDKTLYLWDLAGTLFFEKWDAKKTGYSTFGDWLVHESGKKKEEISEREYEEAHRIPYTRGWYFRLGLQPGYKEVLNWTKNNETFSTGMQAQMDWRAEYLNPLAGYDIRKYFKNLVSTFDYGETNKKTTAMLLDYLEKKYRESYSMIVYTDDKINNCNFFINAAKIIRKKYPDFRYRLYHILNNSNGIREKKGYWEIGNLLDFLVNEKKLIK